MTANCPTCGGMIDTTKRMLVDINTHNIVFKGQRFIVDPKMAELLYVLNENSPAPVSDVELSIAMWGIHEQDHKDVRTLGAQYICRARKFLTPLGGVNFERVHHKGFRVYYHDMDPAANADKEIKT